MGCLCGVGGVYGMCGVSMVCMGCRVCGVPVWGVCGVSGVCVWVSMGFLWCAVLSVVLQPKHKYFQYQWICCFARLVVSTVHWHPSCHPKILEIFYGEDIVFFHKG